MTKLGISGMPQRRQGDENGLDGVPWPVRAIVAIGVTGSIALGSLWFLADEVRGYQRRTEPTINETAMAAKAIAASVAATESNHAGSSARIEKILERISRQICVQNAHTLREQQKCAE